MQQFKQPKNPVKIMDSVEALDLIDMALKLLREGRLTFKFIVRNGEPVFELFREGKWTPVDPSFLDRLREQRLAHRRALRGIIGQESL